MDKKSIKELIVEFIFHLERGSNLPDELRGKIPLQHIIWELIEDCNGLILCLITNKFLRNSTIERIIKSFNDFCELISYYLTPEDQVKLAVYWMKAIQTIKSRCLEEEQFEACANIKKFSDLYYMTYSMNE
jgi:hypothetical protein